MSNIEKKFTYFDDNLGTSLNKVRLLIGDINSTDVQFSDDEINFFIDEESNIYGAASVACQALAMKFTPSVDKKVGPLWLEQSQIAAGYKTMAKDFKTKSNQKGSARIYLGGETISNKNIDKADTDVVQPFFKRNQNDFVQPASSC